MSIRNDEEFRRLLDGTKIYYGMFATSGTNFNESKEYQEKLIRYIDSYVDNRCASFIYNSNRRVNFQYDSVSGKCVVGLQNSERVTVQLK